MIPPKPKDVLELANQIVSAESHLEALRSKWASLFGSSEPVKETRVKKERSKRGDTPMRVLAMINAASDEVFDADETAGNLGITVAQARTALRNLYDAKKIDKSSRGNFTALGDSTIKESPINVKNLGYVLEQM